MVRNRLLSAVCTMRQPKCRPRGRRTFLAEDHLHVFEPVAGEARARHRGAAAAVVRLGEAEIDGLVLREAAIERDVMQPALA